MSLVNIVPIPLLDPKEVSKILQPTVEMTGNGDLLCYEGHFGRWFRSSEEAVRKAISAYKEEYDNGACLSFNELYYKFGITPSQIGDEFGYTPSEDYRSEMEFDVTLLPAEENFEDRGEAVLVIETASRYSYPLDIYMEV